MANFSDDELSALRLGRRPSTFSPSSDDEDAAVISPTITTTTSSSSRPSHHIDIPGISSSLAQWSSPPASLLSYQRRPSLVEVYEKSRMKRFSSDPVVQSPTAMSPDPLSDNSTPLSEEGTNFKRGLEINMKDLVGDAVGNMSISPSSRDIVLAARKGLFIIDLEHPFEVPRFLPQGGTWDVADVQWNPHPSRSQYIVSTSSEKMLIWNLGMTGKTSIEHILKSHFRAITDFNWHTTECDVVASTGIDSWIWIWDLRTPRKPAFGLSAFRAAGTQVKWNRQDGNFLASAHGNEVFIWDRRKGSLPVDIIQAHSSKIYGIDWSHHLRNEIVTCSLDKTIKTWDINEKSQEKSCIRTNYPVWRARNLPFGQGVLSLPQRGETRLEMYARGEDPTLVETYEGHTDVVKEFVWRKGAPDEFQLITWSKDRTLRFWPVTPDVMQRVGHMPDIPRGRALRVKREPTLSYRKPPESTTDAQRLLSAPIGHRSILAEVRAGVPPRSTNLITQPHPGSSARAMMEKGGNDRTPTLTNSKPIAMANRNRGGTMSRGAVTGKSVVGMDNLGWLTSFRFGAKRGSSSGAASAEAGSSNSSRLGSSSRAPSSSNLSEVSKLRQRSVSRSRTFDEGNDPETGHSLQDEITSTLKKLVSSKIKLEKHDLTKKRTCTLGLHGPWGDSDSSSVFIRVTFTFPPKYPHGGNPEGTPSIEIERNPLISPRDRSYILKKLKVIRETRRPCLEACLRFLLTAEDEQDNRVGLGFLDSESSDDEHRPTSKRNGKELTVSILRNHKNLAEPRTSQGAFGPNGELICFFRAPPRIVRPALRGMTPSEVAAAPTDEHTGGQQQQESLQQSRLFQSPALVSDAVTRLRSAAKDQLVRAANKPENGMNISRMMTNLLTGSQHRMPREATASGSASKNWAMMPTRRSNVFMMDTISIEGPDIKMGRGYVFQHDTLAGLCEENARTSRAGGRYDHEGVFRLLGSLFQRPELKESAQTPDDYHNSFACDAMGIRVVQKLYDDLAKRKDIQMLAMLSSIVLQTPHGGKRQQWALNNSGGTGLIDFPSLRASSGDYFTISRALNNLPSPSSPHYFPAITPTPTAPSISSSTSSRASWSGLFGRLQDGFIATPAEVTTFVPPEAIGRQSSSGERPTLSLKRLPKRTRKESSYSSNSPTGSAMSKSWTDVPIRAPKGLSVSFSSAGHKRSGVLRVHDITPLLQENKRIVFEPSIGEERAPTPGFSDDMIQQMHRHVYVYAELLFRWGLFQRRLELLNAVPHLDNPPDDASHKLSIVKRCANPECGMLLDDAALVLDNRTQRTRVCRQCSLPASLPSCSICRLPVRGLSRNCLRCCHVTHISCWNSLDAPICPTGCGCFCSGLEGIYTRPSTRIGMSPTPNGLMLTSTTS